MTASSQPLRVLMLASYFPKPLNPLMGNWALAQAQALRRNGVDLRVISCTSWVPRLMARSKGSRAYAYCPSETEWDGTPVSYPRWLFYPVGPFRNVNDKYPDLPGLVSWLSVRTSIRNAVRAFRPKLIYAHHTGANGHLALRIHREFGLPYVITDHDFGELKMCETWPRRRRLFERVALDAAAMVSVARRMELQMKAMFPGATTLTVQNGTDPIPPSILSRARPEAFHGKTVVFSCGTFYRRKDFPALIEAFARICAKHPNAVLRIAGDGEDRALVHEAIRRHGLGERVTLLGFKSHDEVMQEMVWSDIFALIGWDEPFATVYVEAMAAGKPILCCSDGGITDVLHDGVHGLTVPPRDTAAAAAALDRLLGEPSLRLGLGRASKMLFDSTLHWDHHARRMIEIFRTALTR
jgi:glycosyltransferase involved in cell wall biosynthesis